jgi:hypothetical protein
MQKRFILIPMMFVAACASGPQAAPGTNPGDMSAEEHEAEAEEHEGEAEEHEEEADKAQKLPQQVGHENEAAEEEDIAGQHKKAAEEAE